MWDKLSWKEAVLVRSKILGLFVNTLTAEYKNSRVIMQNFPQQLQTQLCSERKAFSGFFIAFLKCILNLEHFETKDESPSLTFPEIIDSKGGGDLDV